MTSRSGPDMRDRATPGISAADITVTYRNGVTALSNATFEVPRGSIAALVGVNGAGKSTLFKAIMGFVPAAKGSISVLGLPVKEALRRNMVAYVPQSEEVDWSFPVLVEDVVMMGRYGHMGFLRRPSAEDRKAVAEALARVDMTSYAKRQIGELSGGQRKRVFLARALAQQADVILLDEPFTGIDVKTEEADRQAAAVHARRRPGHAGLHPQSRFRARILRPHGARQGHGAGLWADRRDLHPGQSRGAPSAACCATSFWAARTCTTTRTSARSHVLTDDERPFVIYEETATAKDGDT